MKKLFAVVLTLLLPVIAQAQPGSSTTEGVPKRLEPFFQPPPAWSHQFGKYQSPLTFDDGRPVQSHADWRKRRQEILRTWHAFLGAWPPLLEKPAFGRLGSRQEVDPGSAIDEHHAVRGAEPSCRHGSVSSP